MRGALSRVVGRHDALRAIFESTPAGLESRILPPGAVECPVVEVDSQTTQSLTELSRQFGLVPYVLTQGPLFRFKLIRVDAQTQMLLCGFHHLVIDGHSWPIFVDELLQDLAGGALAPLAGQYNEFCDWERQQQAAGNWDPAREYWRSVYQAVPPVWDLPADHARPRVPDPARADFASVLPADVAQRLRSFAAAQGTTPFRVGYAAFFAFLHRITGRDELLVATTLIGRSEPRFARLIGFCVNPGGVRVRIQDSTRFDHLVADVAAQLSASVRHEHYPFSLAVHDAALRREPGRDLISPVSFTKLPTSRARHVAGSDVFSERIFLNNAGHEVAVYMHNNRGEFRFTWTYQAALFDRGTIEAFAGQFQEILRRALDCPETPVSRLDLVSPSERRRILLDWNATDRKYPEARSLHALIEAQVARTPHRIAVVAQGLQLTYREVDAAANRIAWQLRAREIGVGRFVPIVMEPSAEFLIAELAVMKSGAAFVPLDPNWPKQRLEALLERLGSCVILSRHAAAAELASPSREVLILDGTRTAGIAAGTGGSPDGGGEASPGVDVGPDDPIYCMFTSGSTGLPKGAINRHRGIINRLSVMTEMFGAPAEDAVLATSPAFFDSSVWQYFWPLTCGGRSVIFPREQVANPAAIPGLMERNAITFTDFVPSMFQLLVEHLREHPEARPAFDRLRRIMIGGEAMVADPVYEFKGLFPHVAITNSYGPTETSIGVIFHEVPGDYTSPVPIGRPIPNVRAVILDRHRNLTPAGIAGELCLGGECMGLGYLADPEATARVFVANPFPELNCSTLYRTGDLARFRTDGIIEFLGRIDQQIKIRGIRIEPGEIETILMQHPQVRQAVVLVREDKPGDKRLVAYAVVEDRKTRRDASDLRVFLGERLPAYMVPAAFVLLDVLPLTTTGKVDRKAVARLDGVVLQSDTPYAKPRNHLEAQIVAIWQELLGRKQVGIHDHFFDLGGDSMMAIGFVAQFGERTGLRLDVRSLYEWPTPAGLAAFLAPERSPGGVGTDQPDVATETSTAALPDREPIECILAKQRALVAPWKGERMSANAFVFTLNGRGTRRGLFWCLQGFREFTQLAAYLGPDQPVHGMRSGHLILKYTDENVAALASYYASEMIALQPEGPFIVGGNCQGARIARAIALELKRWGRSVALLVLMEESSFREYGGRVALLFGRESHYNPYQPGADPDALFRKSYPGGFSVTLITGRHGHFFEEPGIASLAQALTELLPPPREAHCPRPN